MGWSVLINYGGSEVWVRADDILFQAENFLSWHNRSGGDLEANFKFWARSKDFLPDDERAIEIAVKDLTRAEALHGARRVA